MYFTNKSKPVQICHDTVHQGKKRICWTEIHEEFCLCGLENWLEAQL